MSKFEETTITLAGSKETMPGKRLGDTGLGYWTGQDEEETVFYVPSHLPSGYRMAPEPFCSEEVCQQYIEAIAPLMNWNQPMDILAFSPDYPPVQVAPLYKQFHFEDAAATAGGGQW